MCRRSFLACAFLTSFSLSLETSDLRKAQPQEKPKAKQPPDASLAPIQDQPGLPGVLLIGDSISIGYTIPVREALAGKANVHRAAENCGPTRRGVERLDTLAGPGAVGRDPLQLRPARPED